MVSIGSKVTDYRPGVGVVYISRLSLLCVYVRTYACVLVRERYHSGTFSHLSLSLSVRDPLAQFEVEKREHELKMKKMEAEMEQVFEMKVQEKMQKLKDIEADVSTCITY